MLLGPEIPLLPPDHIKGHGCGRMPNPINGIKAKQERRFCKFGVATGRMQDHCTREKGSYPGSGLLTLQAPPLHRQPVNKQTRQVRYFLRWPYRKVEHGNSSHISQAGRLVLSLGTERDPDKVGTPPRSQSAGSIFARAPAVPCTSHQQMVTWETVLGN